MRVAVVVAAMLFCMPVFAQGVKLKSVTNSIGIELVEIPAGAFTMGEGEGVAVTLTQGFFLGRTEVTQGEWMQVMTSQNWSGKANVEIGDKFPASFVSWDDATEFCETLTEIERKAGTLKADEEYRLPTEAERECACRAGTTTAYSFGNDKKQLGDYAWFSGNAYLVGTTCTATCVSGVRIGTTKNFQVAPIRLAPKGARAA
jgi:formylglycine-generating enzyme required for sulfatase activity